MGKTYAGIDNPFYVELPSAYQAVKFIGSSGTQYINTGVIPNANSKAKLICSEFPESANSIAMIFGSRQSSGNKEFEVQFSNSKYYYCYNTEQIPTDLSPDISGKVTIDIDGNKCIITNTNGTKTITATAATLSTTLPIFLFAVNQAGSPIYPCSSKIYSCQIWDGSTLVRNFIPCYRKSDNVAGLYDTVSNTFYTNTGTGTFSIGESITPTLEVAKEINKIYAGVNGVARQVKKAYVGDSNGIARLVYSAENKIWLIRDGENLCGLYVFSSQGNISTSKVDDYLAINGSRYNSKNATLQMIAGNIITYNLSKICFEFEMSRTVGSGSIYIRFGYSNGIPSLHSPTYVYNPGTSSSFSHRTVTSDATPFNNKTFVLSAGNGSSSYANFVLKLYNLWLE